MRVRAIWHSLFIAVMEKARLVHLICHSDPDHIAAILFYYEHTLGGEQSFKSKLPTTRDREALPWYTYPAIEYLAQFDFSLCSVFEYGSGNSSKFWAQRALSVESVEANSVWYETVNVGLVGNQKLMLHTDKDKYVSAIHSTGQLFDIVVIDAFWRFNCAIEAVACLKQDGFIILDNSDWYPNTASLIRASGFTQVDFIGWGPINSYAWCTSIFSRGESIIPRRIAPSIHVLGGLVQFAEDDRKT